MIEDETLTRAKNDEYLPHKIKLSSESNYWTVQFQERYSNYIIKWQVMR